MITPQLTQSKSDDHLGISVDNLEVAQFIYLLLNNKRIRDVIDTITSKVVLILGRFSTERKYVLDGLRAELRHHNYTPVLFDFERPNNRSFIETISTLAGLSRFVVADLTDAKVVLQELQAIVHDFPSLPVQPLLLKGAQPPSVLVDFANAPNFLGLHQYADPESLVNSLKGNIIAPAEAKAHEFRARREQFARLVADLCDGTQDT